MYYIKNDNLTLTLKIMKLLMNRTIPRLFPDSYIHNGCIDIIKTNN